MARDFLAHRVTFRDFMARNFLARDFLARDFLAHRVTFRDFMARNFLARDFLGGYHSNPLGAMIYTWYLAQVMVLLILFYHFKYIQSRA